MATSSGHKLSPLTINKLSDIDFQAEVEIICNYLRWESFPKRSTENFKSILERRAQTFCVEEYVPTDADDASSALSVALQLFYTGSAESTGDENVEDPVEAAELPQVDGCKRLVISHPRLQLNILNTVHTGQEGSNTHLSVHEMWKKIIPVYYWRNIGTSIIEFIKNCEMCKLQDKGPTTDLSTAPLTSTSNSENDRSRDTEMEMEDDHDDSFESFQLSNEVPYHEEVSQIYDYLKSGKYPPNGTPNFKRGLRRRARQYVLAEDDTDGTNKGPSKKLYFVKAQERKANQNAENGSKRGVEVYMRLVVSMPEEQQKILQIAHIGASGEHCGRDKMVDSLTKLYFWKGLYRSVMVFLENCSECQTKRTHPQTRSFEQSVPKQDVWETPRAREAAKGITLVLPPEVKPKPPIPQELTELPKGLSHISGLDTEVEALVLYLYLKWQKYPPECTDGFKRTVRKKANAFFLHEESGEDNGNNWCLYYKGDLNKDPRDTGQVVEAEKITRDVKSKESAASREVGEMEETDQAMEITGSKETEDTRETDRALQTLEIKGGEVTEEMDSAVTTKSKVIRKERSMDYRTRHKLYVYRKPDQQKILQHVHLHGGRNGRHAGRDKVSSVISRHFFWRGYKDDILMILTKCKICQMKRTANGGMEYNLYLQKLDRDGIQNGYEDAFEDHSTHKLPLKLQAYLENAMSMEAGWEAEDLTPRQGPLSNLNSSGSLREGDQTVHCQDGEGTTEHVRLTDGALSSFTYQGGDSCPQRFRDRDSLQYHKREKHINRTSIKCTLCTKVFKRPEDLSAHMRCHTKEKPYECEYCKKPFRYRSGLTHHRKLHFGFKPFACPECPLRFVSRGDLNMHFKSAHEGRGDYLCDICGKSFATPVRLKMHKKIHMESRQRFICNICGKVLATSTTFKYHMYIHTGERHILCELCGKGFKKKDELNKHMRRHMGIKPHQCHICQQRFSLKGDLRDHIRGHEGASLYQCDVCHKRFKNRRSMTRCKRKHAQAPTEEGFRCNTCGEVLGNLVDLVLHRETHVGAQIIRQEVVIE